MADRLGRFLGLVDGFRAELHTAKSDSYGKQSGVVLGAYHRLYRYGCDTLYNICDASSIVARP